MSRLPATWVLVRGLTRERAHWGAFPTQLATALHGARVIMLDLPGTGVLHRGPCPANVGAMAGACRVQLQGLGVDGPVNLLGLSLGGMVAAEWLHRWPSEIASAVIVNSSARGLGPLHRRLRLSSWPGVFRVVLRWRTRAAEHEVLRLTSACPQRHIGVVDEWTRVHRERPVSLANALRQLLGAARHRLAQGRPACPVLVACSERDALVDPHCSRQLATAWGGDIVVHPEAGHDLPLDDGAWLAARIADWAGRR